MNARKLLLNEKVEVRQIEEGLQGSWYSAVVIGVSDMRREVEYDELLCETEDSKLVESIPVTGEIEGAFQRPSVKTNHRGRIRPLPSISEAFSSQVGLNFGFCVDVLFEDAWWEGVIFDSNDGSEERSVFFPDEGDDRCFKVSNLRATREWDEFSGTWRERGFWTLVKLTEECKTSIPLAKFTKCVWSHLRVNYGFQKMISEWTCGAYSVWKKYFKEVVSVIAGKSIGRALGYPINSRVAKVRPKGNKIKRYQSSDKDGTVSSKISHRRNNTFIHSSKSKHDYLSESKNLDNCVNSGANGSSTHTNAYSERSHQTDLSRASSNQCGEISNVCSVQMSERVEDVATTSYHSVPNNEKQSQIVISRRKMQQAVNTLAPQKIKPFVAHQQQLIRFQSRSPKKQKHVRMALHSHLHGNKTQHSMQRQMEKNLATRFPKRNLRMLSFSLRKKRSCLKVKKRFPKRILRSNTKNKLSCTKEGPVSELSQKDDNSLDIKAASRQEFESNDDVLAVKKRSKKSRRNDPVCFVCQYGDDLRPCGNCTSSYHITCIGLEEVPDANWFCPSCRCGLCGKRSSNEDELFTEVCYQCSRQYHRDCIQNTYISVLDDSPPEMFCSKRCFQICARLHEHFQTLHKTPVEGLSWTITRSRRNNYNFDAERIHPRLQLSQVMKVLHECFEPTIEPQSKKDLVAEVVYNSSSKFKRLDFHGFYVMVLQNGEELACVATLRIHGHKVAEMPLIATPFTYRRKGMCRLLMREMEKMLIDLGVERLVLPAISQLRETWLNVFGFEEMPASLRHEFSGYPFLVFSGTTMFHKMLSESTLTEYLTLAQQDTKSTAAGVSQQCENDNGGEFGSCYKRTRRPRIVPKDQRTSQDLYFKRGRRVETYNKEKTTEQGLNCTRRRRTEAVGKDRMPTQATNRNMSPIKYVYKRRRVLATREGVH